MSLKRIAMNKKLSTLLVSICGALAVSVMLTAPAAAQNLRINTGCPTMGDPNIGKYTIDQLNALCHNSSSGGSSGSSQPAQPAAAEDGAALNCGHHKALAYAARINPGFVEGQTSQAIVDKYCGGGSSPDSALPQGGFAGFDQVSGVFNFERGYYNSYSGNKGRICKGTYSGRAYLNNGTIEFTSGGHTWRGTIAQNSFVSITRDGVTPRPKNPTSISGPITDADLYNGYCGPGYFRLYAG